MKFLAINWIKKNKNIFNEYGFNSRAWLKLILKIWENAVVKPLLLQYNKGKPLQDDCKVIAR